MDELLDLIFEIESSSGRDKKAYIPNPEDGSLGGYQLTPRAYQDIQKMFPGKWGKKKFKDVVLDNNTAREAAKDRISFLEVDLANTYGIAPTKDSILAAYNQGAGGIASGNPKILAKAKEYVDKAHGIRSKYTEPLKR